MTDTNELPRRAQEELKRRGFYIGGDRYVARKRYGDAVLEVRASDGRLKLTTTVDLKAGFEQGAAISGPSEDETVSIVLRDVDKTIGWERNRLTALEHDLRQRGFSPAASVQWRWDYCVLNGVLQVEVSLGMRIESGGEYDDVVVVETNDGSGMGSPRDEFSCGRAMRDGDIVPHVSAIEVARILSAADQRVREAKRSIETPKPPAEDPEGAMDGEAVLLAGLAERGFEQFEGRRVWTKQVGDRTLQVFSSWLVQPATPQLLCRLTTPLVDDRVGAALPRGFSAAQAREFLAAIDLS